MSDAQSQKDKAPSDNLSTHDFSREAEEQRLQKEFRDFLVAPHISGTKSSYDSGSRIPVEHTEETGNVVEVAKINIDKDGEEHKDSIILLHRNRFNEIEGIEIRCSCGKKTIVQLNVESEDASVIDKSIDDSDEVISAKEYEGREPASPDDDENAEDTPINSD